MGGISGGSSDKGAGKPWLGSVYISSGRTLEIVVISVVIALRKLYYRKSEG
jgi:hypothetical protein